MRRPLLAVCLTALATATVAWAQEMPPLPVLFTPAIEGEVRGTVELTGSVTSRRESVVAAEVSGLVVELAARRGERLKKGAPLVRLRSRSAGLRLEAARGELKEAEARRSLAESARERARRLFDEKVISQERLDESLTEYEATQGRVDRLRAEVNRLTDELARTTVRAPFDGAVTEELIAVGEWLGAGDAVARMVDVGHLELELEVPERLVSGVAPGESVSVGFDAVEGLEVVGRVRAVVPAANPQARTFPVMVEIDNTDGRIGVGMLGRARLEVGEPQQAVLVPKDAVVLQGRESIVFVLDPEDRPVAVPVETGGALGGWIAVRGEIESGSRVVTVGNERLQPGFPVAPELKEYERP